MQTRKRLLTLFVLLITCYGSAWAASPEKITVEELLAKHLASIGSSDAWAAAKTRIAVGKAKALSHSKAVRDIAGVGQFASDGDRVLLAMIFNLLDYPYEKVGYDGKKTTVALVAGSGSPTALGEFLKSHDAILKQGLLGGVLSSSWPLRDLASRKPQLSVSGKGKIDGREVYKLKYAPNRGAAELLITLFFDAETFRHVRTEYEFSLPATMGPRPSSTVQSTATDTGSQSATRYQLLEDFSDFKEEGALTLPHTYNLHLTIEAQPTKMLEWVINFSQFVFNQPIEVSAFNVAASK